MIILLNDNTWQLGTGCCDVSCVEGNSRNGSAAALDGVRGRSIVSNFLPSTQLPGEVECQRQFAHSQSDVGERRYPLPRFGLASLFDPSRGRFGGRLPIVGPVLPALDSRFGCPRWRTAAHLLQPVFPC